MASIRLHQERTEFTIQPMCFLNMMIVHVEMNQRPTIHFQIYISNIHFQMNMRGILKNTWNTAYPLLFLNDHRRISIHFMHFSSIHTDKKWNVTSQEEDLVFVNISISKIKWKKIIETIFLRVTKKGLWSMNLQL